MAGYRRVFLSNPGLNVLSAIEGVNVIDIAPPATFLGAGTGVVGHIGEFENGAFNQPTRVFGATDLEETFGGFGFTHDGVPYSGVTSRRSGGASAFWEGNGFLALRNKRFAGLIITRVDNSSGEVAVSRLACKTGTEVAPYNMEPAQTVILSVDGGGAATATWDAAAASVTGAGFPGPAAQCWQVDDDGGPGFVDMTTEFNDVTTNDVVLFPATEATDDYFALGFARPFNRAIFNAASGTAGVGGVVVWEYWNGSAWAALSGVVDGTTSFTAGASDGQVVSWTVPTDWDTLTLNAVEAYYVRARITTVYTTNPIYDQGFVEQQNITGFLGGETFQLAIDGGPTRVITYTAAEQTPAQVVSYTNSQLAAAIMSESAGELVLTSLIRGTAGSIQVVGGTGAATLGFVAGTTSGTGDVANIDAVSQAEVRAVIEADAPGTAVDTVPGTNVLRICATSTPGTGTIQVTGGAGLVGLGLTVDASPISAATGTAEVTVPAGTRVRDTTTSTDWVTMIDTVFAADSGGPQNIRVRPWLDDDTAPTAAAGDIDTIVDSLADGFSVTNAADISRIGDAALDAAYETAFNATLDVNGVPFDINIQYAARHTANIQRFGRDNALNATATGHRARKFITAPPIGTAVATATGSTGVGVGNNRDQRLFYLFPGVTTFVSEIARVGTDGGPGFTADGVIDVPADSFYAGVRSLLPPEENAGQQLSDTVAGPMNALTLESAYDPEQGGLGLTIDNYINFKDNGIISARLDRTAGMVFQSDVTSVNPNTDTALADAKRRFLGDLIIDSLFDLSSKYVKKLNTPARRRALTTAINTFLNSLRSENQPELSRIEDFSVVDDTTSTQRGAGFQFYTIKVRQYASMDYIVLTTEVGTTVVVEELAA